MREAPSVVIINRLLKAGARVRAHDPVAIVEAQKIFGNRVAFSDDAYDTIQGADGLVVVTEWGEFRTPDFHRMKKLLRAPVVFDGRNIYNQTELRKLGFTYYGIGRK